MNESRVRESPAGAPATVNAAAVNAAAKPTGNATAKAAGNAVAKPAGNSAANAPRSDPKAENSAAILRWVTTRKRHVQLPAALPTA
ncbi:hypothetical protein CCR75_008103 [Bremia lactucae]|uniref:Uncharacterized protein n=1 Tax=Bremia lactucae TaxID=4779 RepID=A0A976IF69_BRELC|nr:hypothetical protein CCR75_008103 [Bremia lactucae]